MKSSNRLKSRCGRVLLVVVIATAATAASATDSVFMLVPGIPGGSQAPGRSGWIDVLAFSGTAVAPSLLKAKPPVQPCQIAITKQLDIAGPRLWAATATGQIFNSVDIQVAAPTGFVFYDILLTNAQITQIGDSGANELPTESLSLAATSVTLTFTPQNPDGSGGTPVTTSFVCK